LNDNAARATKIVWRNWYDLIDVQEAVNLLDDKDVRDLFTQAPPSTTTIQMITSTYIENDSLIKQIEQSLNWECAKKSRKYKSYLNGIKDKLKVKNL